MTFITIVKKFKHGNKVKIFFTDTCSLVYGIKTDTVYEDFDKDNWIWRFFDFSEYPRDSKFYDNDAWDDGW